jgi:hypothetical protein
MFSSSPSALREAVGQHQVRALSPTTVRYCYSVPRIALGRAVKLGRVHRNVATLIDPPGKARRDLQPLSALEARQLLAAVAEHRLSALFLN